MAAIPFLCIAQSPKRLKKADVLVRSDKEFSVSGKKVFIVSYAPSYLSGEELSFNAVMPAKAAARMMITAAAATRILCSAIKSFMKASLFCDLYLGVPSSPAPVRGTDRA